jgi:hypothetical protein
LDRTPLTVCRRQHRYDEREGNEIVLAWKNASLCYTFGGVLIIMIGSYLFYQLSVWTVKLLTPPGSVS